MLFAALAGTVVHFVWGMLAWMVLPIHDGTIHSLPDEAAWAALIESQELASAVYALPMPKEAPGATDAEKKTEMDDWTARHRRGPFATLTVRREGSEPMPPSMLLTGGLIDFAACLVAACLLCGAASGCCRTYAQRAAFVFGLGLFAAMISHGALWNWMHVPADYTVAMIFDVCLGWLLVGLAMAAIIRPAERERPPQ